MTPAELICEFVNTADLEDGTDELADARGLRDWLARHRLARPRDRASAAEAAEARALRDALRELLRSHNGAKVDAAPAVATLARVADVTGLRIDFASGSPIRFVPARDGVAGGLGRVVAAVGEAMGDGSWPRLKACRADSCRWAFVDTARNHSRRWCDMNVCGNRAKARRYRSRRA